MASTHSTGSLVAVIMPVYNGGRFLREAMDSVLAQSFVDFELLVVDDASTDGSAEIVKTFSDRRVRLLQNESNLGPAASRNHALDVARGKHIAFFDSDDIAHPQWLEKELEFLRTHAGYKIVCAWREDIDADGNVVSPPHGYADTPEKLPATMLFYNCLPTSTLLVERSAIDGLRFKSDLPVASDYEMWVRLIERGAAFVLPENLAQYRIHAANITHRKQQMADACLGQIIIGQLKRLGLQPDNSEIDLHLKIMQFTFGTPKATVVAVEGWLLKLQEANDRTRFYGRGPFRQVLADRWYGVCHSACGHGKWTWKTFNASPLRQGARLSWRQRSRLCYLVFRATIKNSFPRLAQWATKASSAG